MRRRILIRRHSAYLLHCIRFFYGAMLLNLVAIAFFHHKSVLAQVISMSGLWGKFLVLGMAGSAALLIIETLAGWLWDVINSHQLRQFYEQNSKLCRHVQTIRTDIKSAQALVLFTSGTGMSVRHSYVLLAGNYRSSTGALVLSVFVTGWNWFCNSGGFNQQ